jgi:hypothetical protein
MIDFSTIQANPIPPSFQRLQRQNDRLALSNKRFRLLAQGAIALSLVCLAALWLEKHKNTRDEDFQ